MSAERILVIDAHPDPDPKRFVHALADAYLRGADERRQTRLIRLSELDFPLLRTADDWKDGKPPATIASAQADITWAQHIVFFYPLWLGDLPALLKGFLEQTLRPGFALRYRGRYPHKLLKGRSARIVVTMGMPAFFYRLIYRAHSLKSLERNILRFVGIGPVAETIIGLVESSATNRKAWLKDMEELGRVGL